MSREKFSLIPAVISVSVMMLITIRYISIHLFGIVPIHRRPSLKAERTSQSRCFKTLSLLARAVHPKPDHTSRTRSVNTGSGTADDFSFAQSIEIDPFEAGSTVRFRQRDIIEIYFHIPDPPGRTHSLPPNRNAGVRKITLIHSHAGDTIESRLHRNPAAFPQSISAQSCNRSGRFFVRFVPSPGGDLHLIHQIQVRSHFHFQILLTRTSDFLHLTSHR